MSVFDEQPPIINVSSFSHWLKKNYSFFNSKSIKLSRLNSERDVNLLIKGAGTKQYVVKISNPKESLAQLEYQDLLINHLRQSIQLRNIYPEIFHKKILFYKDRNERGGAVRILTYIEGDMYAKSKNSVKTRTPRPSTDTKLIYIDLRVIAYNSRMMYHTNVRMQLQHFNAYT